MPENLKRRKQKGVRSEETLRAILTRKGGPMQPKRLKKSKDARKRREAFEGYAEGQETNARYRLEAGEALR